ncbi:MAG: TOBE domain-containing protein, partial [Paracoccaceae bacterium]
VMQAGAPMDLYHEPANLFVAGFLGAPSMNFLDVAVEAVHETHITVSAASLAPIDVPRKGRSFTVGQTATLGIRPQYLRPAEGENGKLHGKVILTERLGSETVIDTTLECGSKIIAAFAEDSIQTPGTAAHFDFDPNQAHVFPERR